MSVPHSRNASSDTTSSNSSYNFILEHMLSYPGTYEIPLRTMYTLNCAPRAQPPGPAAIKSAPVTSNSSPIAPGFPYDQQIATAQFTSNLMAQIAKLPHQPSSLPPAFVTSFLNRSFPMELHLVDFPQSLTALDYLKDLETRRRKEVSRALEHLRIDQNVLETAQDSEELAKWYPMVADWVRTLENKEKKLDALYTQLYIALRRWILINEMCLTPFNKHSCHAMLNTLYPPVMSAQPTSKLTIPLLMQQRDGFFNYIKHVEKRGPSILDNLMKQGAKDDEENGWPAVKRTLDNYLNMANTMITESQDVSNMELDVNFVAISKTPSIPPPEPRVIRKTDSGVSFNSEGKHSKTSSTSSNKSTMSTGSRTTTSSFDSGRSGGSTLERLAREFKKMRPRTRIVVDEIVHQPAYPMQYTQPTDLGKENTTPVVPTPSKSRFPGLRKMRSLGTLGDLKHNNSSMASLRKDNFGHAFDPVAMRRKREDYMTKNTNFI